MIVVTGGTGLIGSHLLPLLAKGEEPVRAIIREGSRPELLKDLWAIYTPDPESLYQKIEWYRADMLNKASLADAIRGWSKIYHCAGYVSFDRRKRKEIRNTNVIAVRNLVDCCLEMNTGKIVHVSSVAAIASPHDNGPADESSGWPVKSWSEYARTKTLGELEIWRGIHEGLDAVIVNPSIILGAAVNNRGSSMLFETLKRGLDFYPSGSAGFVDVRDVAEAMVKLGNSDLSGERFVLNGANLSYRELFEKALAGFGKKPPKYKLSIFVTFLAWIGESILTFFNRREPRITRSTIRSSRSHQSYSAEKITRSTGFRFRSIDDTVGELVGYYKEMRRS
jgi:dihydroflavonol-4-reductase